MSLTQNQLIQRATNKKFKPSSLLSKAWNKRMQKESSTRKGAPLKLAKKT